MTREDALKRLQQCRDNQPDAWQVIVSRDIVDALLAPAPRVDIQAIYRRLAQWAGSS